MKKTLLIVDDAKENIDVLVGLLRDRYRLKAARNGGKALWLAAVARDRPDLVLLDILMPDMDGFEVCRRLKDDERTRAIPVIFLSSLAEPLDKLKAFSCGAVDYITKPFHPAETLARIETQLKVCELQVELAARNTRLVQSSEQLATARDMAEAAHRAKAAFLRALSHEMHGQLRMIAEFAQRLHVRALADGADERLAEIGQVQAATRALQKVIDEGVALASRGSEESAGSGSGPR